MKPSTTKSLRDMTDTQVMKAFGDPSLALQLMRLGHEIEAKIAPLAEHNALALVWWNAFQSKKYSIKYILSYIIEECYLINPRGVIELLGENLINNIQSALHEK